MNHCKIEFVCGAYPIEKDIFDCKYYAKKFLTKACGHQFPISEDIAICNCSMAKRETCDSAKEISFFIKQNDGNITINHG